MKERRKAEWEGRGGRGPRGGTESKERGASSGTNERAWRREGWNGNGRCLEGGGRRLRLGIGPRRQAEGQAKGQARSGPLERESDRDRDGEGGGVDRLLRLASRTISVAKQGGRKWKEKLCMFVEG